MARRKTYRVKPPSLRIDVEEADERTWIELGRMLRALDLDRYRRVVAMTSGYVKAYREPDVDDVMIAARLAAMSESKGEA